MAKIILLLFFVIFLFFLFCFFFWSFHIISSKKKIQKNTNKIKYDFRHIFFVLALFPLKIHCNPRHSILHISFIEDPIPSSTSRSSKFHNCLFCTVCHNFFNSHPIAFKIWPQCLFPNSASLSLFDKFSHSFTLFMKFIFFVSLSLKKYPQPSYPLTFFPTQNFTFLKPSLFLFFCPFLKKNNFLLIVVTCAGENRQMEEEIVTFKTKIEDLDQTFIDLHLQHSSMSNRQQPESSRDTEFSASSNFCGSKIEFPRFNGDDPSGWIHKT